MDARTVNDPEDGVNKLLSRLVALHAAGPTVLVAIDGAGGSGKSFLARSVARELAAAGTPVAVVHFDDFFLLSGQRTPGSPSFDWRRLRDEVLAPLGRGEPARYARYDWSRDELSGTTEVPPGRVVLVEGVFTCRRELADLYDLRVWVDCPRGLRLARGLARDGEEARERWERDWMPAEDRYVEAHRPSERADFILSGAPR